jgi:glucose/mannose-6-phosphate isomerase
MQASATRKPRVDLDDRASYQGLDPTGMLDLAIDFPDQLERAAEIGAAFRPPDALRDPSLILLSGMGGSAAAGDLLARLCEPTGSVPFLVNRDYRIPKCVGPDTLFIASSYSGNTEETLAATKQALRRRARVVCVTTGGELGGIAARRKLPLIEIPTDPPMPPRAALAFSFVPLLFLLSSLGLLPGARRQMKEALEVTRRLREQLHPETSSTRNRAKQLASHLFDKIPWVQGTVGLMSAVAYRWRCQFNENSKTLAYSSEYPELNHNEVVGWELPAHLARGLGVIVVKEPDAQPRIQARIDITRDLTGAKADPQMIEAEGDSPLARALWAVYLGDFTSVYLALLGGHDPAAIAAIVELKRRLARL